MLKKLIPPPAVRHWIRRQVRTAGYSINRFPRLHLLQHHGVNLLFDVGASEGLYGEEIRALGYTGRIVSFEPRADAFASLSERAARDPKWEAVPFALGEEVGTSVLHIAAGPAHSSSLLDMLPRHAEVAPETAYVGEETIEVRRLDDIFETYCRPGDVPFVKLDVQGYEKHVVEGASGVLDRIVGFQMELSLVPLYKGETLLADMIPYLDARGFTLMEVEPGMRDPASLQLLQTDALFFRSDGAA